MVEDFSLSTFTMDFDLEFASNYLSKKSVANESTEVPSSFGIF